MQIGKLKSINLEILERYEKYGFANKTKMLDHALDLLRERINKENRRVTRDKMLSNYSQSTPESYFSGLDGDDFE